MAPNRTTRTPAAKTTPKESRTRTATKPAARAAKGSPVAAEPEFTEPSVHVPAILPDNRPANAIPYRREVVDVTPSMAQQWLAKIHPNQRAEKRVKIEMYADDMLHRRWREDTEIPLIFDWNDELIDGQNRLRAVEESGRTIRFVVVWGVDPDVMAVVDTGTARNIADALKITGRGEGLNAPTLKVAGTIARRSWHWQLGRYMRSTHKSVPAPTHTAIGEILDREKDIMPATFAGQDGARSWSPAIVQPGTYGFFYLLIMRTDSEVATRFHTHFINPEEIQGGASPILAVRDRLIRSKMAQKGPLRGTNRSALLDQDEHLALLIKAWNLHAAGRPAPRGGTYLQVSKGALTNKNFPQPMTVEEAEKAAKVLEQKGEWRQANR